MVNPQDLSPIVAFQDEDGVVRDLEGNEITGQESRTVIVFGAVFRDL